ncbi:MAG: hypothetical protein Ct9H300mP6_11020 [Gammaproteobacteria bacterium]|nr:MAG: hypothetical protein Ct9H300mP6_11020 [Gammaproteobacteria bacterium]
MRVLFKKELDVTAEGTFTDTLDYKDKGLWNKSLMVLGLWWCSLLFISKPLGSLDGSRRWLLL